ncbi:monocarboxylate transporter 3-like [Watersipora subatra]|uniref:monocarboxylate transporter 3-like n=1 Tax=Watersipora subatra TaxID=2589382 RepID=UPI00355B4811
MDRRASQTLDTENLNKDTLVPNGSFSKFNTEEPLSANEVACENRILEPPDGGWGWVVVFSSCFLNFLVLGISQTFSLYIEDYTIAFKSGVAPVVFANSLLVGILQIIGPFVSALINKWGCRAMGLIGSLTAAASFIISSFSPNVAVFQIVYGILGGLGFGMMYLPAITSVGHYFDKRRALANGIAQCGGGLGMMGVAPFADFLLASYGWRGTHFILAGLLLQGCVFSALIRPLSAKRNAIPKPETVKLIELDDNGKRKDEDEEDNFEFLKLDNRQNNRYPVSNTGSLVSLPTEVEVKSSTSLPSQIEEPRKRLQCLSFCPKPLANILADVIDIEILQNKSMIILCIGNLFGIVGYYVHPMYTADRAKRLGIGEREAALLVSYMGAMGIVGRILPGIVIVAIPKISALMWNNGCLLVAGVSMIAMSQCHTISTIFIATTGISFTAVGFHSLAPVIICDLVGLRKLNNGIGLICLTRGVAAIVGPTIAGLLYDITGDYDATYYMGGASYLISLLLHSILLLQKCHN